MDNYVIFYIFAKMKDMENPFYLNGIIPDHYFCDREAETEGISQALVNKENVVLSSARRIGKTQLIRHIFNLPNIKNAYYTFYIDIYATSSLRELAFFMGKEIYSTLVPKGKKAIKSLVSIVKSLAPSLSINPVTGQPQFSFHPGDIVNPQLTIEEIFTYLEHADKRCIFAIDEFQQIAKYEEKNVEALLRTYIQQMNNCHFIYSGSDRHLLDQMFNSYAKPFYNSAHSFYLDVIEQEKYVSFVRDNMENSGLITEKSAVHDCYRLMEGNTYCMQKVFNHLFAEGYSPVDKNAIQYALEAILEENSHTYKDMILRLSIPQRELIIAIAKEGKAEKLTSGAFVKKHALTSPSSVQKSLAALLELQYVTYRLIDKGKIYSLAEKFLELWIKKEY